MWAFVAVLQEILAGRPAFAESTSDILAGVLRSEPNWSGIASSGRGIGQARFAIDAPEEEDTTTPARLRRSVASAAAGGVLAMATRGLPTVVGSPSW
jgi:hypothetical protein